MEETNMTAAELTLRNNFESLKSSLIDATIEYDKFMKGNNAAGTRLRGEMQNVKSVAQMVRNSVQEVKKES